MKQQPGYISTQLHRAVGESCVFMNYAVWESVAHSKSVFRHLSHPHSAHSVFPRGAQSITLPRRSNSKVNRNPYIP